MAFKKAGGGGPRLVAAMLPKVTGRALAKKGFPNMSLLTDWPAIVGPELAACTCPEKLSWPRRPSDAPVDEEDSEAADRRNAARHSASEARKHKPMRGITLKLRVESHQALDMQYQLEDIISRINCYFGYRAVTDIRIVQGPVNAPTPPAGDTPHPDHIKSRQKTPLADLSNIKDDALRTALARLDEARRS